MFSGAIVIATAAEMCGGLRSRAKAFSRGPKKQKQKFLALIRWSKSKGGSTAEGQNEPPPPTHSSASPPVRGWRPELAPVRSRDETRKGGTARGEHSDRGGGGGGGLGQRQRNRTPTDTKKISKQANNPSGSQNKKSIKHKAAFKETRRRKRRRECPSFS